MGNRDEDTPGDRPPAEDPSKKYDQAFFLDLAAKGKQAWNEWRRVNEDVPITFERTDFSQLIDIAGFAGFEFGKGANFSGCVWRSAVFTGVVFGNQAYFTRAEFLSQADFTGAAFGAGADFTNARFRGETKFDETHFNGSVTFNYQSGSAPLGIISFSHARFDGEASFSGRWFEKTADFTNARFYYPPNFDGVSTPGKIDFTGARIGFAPRGKLLHWTKNSCIPVRLRAFRKVAEDTKNHDLERDLYIEERKAERGVYLHQLFEDLKRAPLMEKPLIFARLLGHGFRILVMLVYWAFADYGRSFMLPFAWLIASGFFFYWRYEKNLAPFIPKACPLADKYEYAVRMFALGNAVPVIGPLTIDSGMKKLLYCPGGDGNCLPIWFQLLVVWQNLFSIILVFFIGLALHNYFKIK